MALSYDEMQQLFEQIGFKGFSMRPYDAEMEYLLSEAEEYNAKAYMIDVVPGGLEDGRNDGIALLEKHYYKKSNMDRLYQKWLEVVLHFPAIIRWKRSLSRGLHYPVWKISWNRRLTKKGTTWNFQWNPSVTWMYCLTWYAKRPLAP